MRKARCALGNRIFRALHGLAYSEIEVEKFLYFSRFPYIFPLEMNTLEVDVRNNSLFESLGFKCGLEIHQQLATEKKLFCHCPVGLTNRRHDAEIVRHMRPTLSELGEYDGTALMEFKTKKEVLYRLYRDRTCTYEMDDTPPFLVNQQAIDYAIRIALLFNCRIVDEIHVIRKQYLDGSIPTGFQRTMIIGLDGWVPYKGRRIDITQVNLEEEACREVSDIGHRITFATDRLSTPLVEIITGSDMKNPQEAAEVCRLLGNSMKITGLVRRGIGTVRQDVNVSVTGGNRVEIKGVYKVANIRPLTAIEAVRQKHLLELRNLYLQRFGSNSIDYTEENITSLFSGTGNMIGRRLESDIPLKVVALYLPNLADVVMTMLQPHWNFGSELSGRVRVIACIDSKPNLFFYSRRDEYDIPSSIWNRLIEKNQKFGQNDDIVLICGASADVVTAINEIKIRIAELAQGVINETRQDMKDGTTDFERILPGPDRMYPDTDHPPVKIAGERVAGNRVFIGEPLWEKQDRWRKIGLSEEQVASLSLSPFASIFEGLTNSQGINLKQAAHILTSVLTDIRRMGYDFSSANSKNIAAFITTALQGKWPNQRIKEELIAILGSNQVEAPSETAFLPEELENSWEESGRIFINKSRENSRNKFKRFAVGRLLKIHPHHLDQIITFVDKKLADKKIGS